ncbi:MAG: hypothetical protein AAB624_01175 [Patescibacteria group bacterium]
MQDTPNSFRPRPETRYIEKIDTEIDSGGDAEGLRGPTIAEEQTHAAEVLALFTGRGIIPREYSLRNGDLLSVDDEPLSEVLDFGVIDAEAQIIEGRLGASKELRRRKIERDNRSKIISLPVGSALVEASAVDSTWTKEEKKAQGYPDDTIFRITARVSDVAFIQLNVILQTTDLSVINRCRRLVNKEASDIWDAEEMLATPQTVGLGEGGLEALSREIETEYIRSTINFTAKNLARSALGRVIIKRRVAKELAKTNSWDYVVTQPDIFNALFDSFVAASTLDKDDWFNAVAVVRGGAWYKLIERYKGNDITNGSVTPEDLRHSAQSAAIGGYVFTACGGTTDMKSLLGGAPGTFMDRMFETATLVNTKAGRGSCVACGDKGDLFGCGIFCRGCNKVWCEEYILTGKQLEANEVKSRTKPKIDTKREKYFKYARAA